MHCGARVGFLSLTKSICSNSLSNVPNAHMPFSSTILFGVGTARLFGSIYFEYSPIISFSFINIIYQCDSINISLFSYLLHKNGFYLADISP